jgi:ABC-type glycerol-3-phosphate transport system permease component
MSTLVMGWLLESGFVTLVLVLTLVSVSVFIAWTGGWVVHWRGCVIRLVYSALIFLCIHPPRACIVPENRIFVKLLLPDSD